MDEKLRVPRTLHEPVQILWFHQDELMVIVVCYIFAMILGGVTWLGMIVFPMIFMNLKRNNPRGYLTHVLVDYGVLQLDLYPDNFIDEFHE